MPVAVPGPNAPVRGPSGATSPNVSAAAKRWPAAAASTGARTVALAPEAANAAAG